MEVGKLQFGRKVFFVHREGKKKKNRRKICVQGGSLMNFLRL